MYISFGKKKVSDPLQQILLCCKKPSKQICKNIIKLTLKILFSLCKFTFYCSSEKTEFHRHYTVIIRVCVSFQIPLRYNQMPNFRWAEADASLHRLYTYKWLNWVLDPWSHGASFKTDNSMRSTRILVSWSNICSPPCFTMSFSNP